MLIQAASLGQFERVNRLVCVATMLFVDTTHPTQMVWYSPKSRPHLTFDSTVPAYLEQSGLTQGQTVVLSRSIKCYIIISFPDTQKTVHSTIQNIAEDRQLQGKTHRNDYNSQNSTTTQILAYRLKRQWFHNLEVNLSHYRVHQCCNDAV